MSLEEIEACKNSWWMLADDKECWHSGKHGGQLISTPPPNYRFWKAIKRPKEQCESAKPQRLLRNIPAGLHSMDSRQFTHESSPTECTEKGPWRTVRSERQEQAHLCASRKVRKSLSDTSLSFGILARSKPGRKAEHRNTRRGWTTDCTLRMSGAAGLCAAWILSQDPLSSCLKFFVEKRETAQVGLTLSVRIKRTYSGQRGNC